MIRHLFTVLAALAVTASTAAAQGSVTGPSLPRPPGSGAATAEKVKVELAFATEHVPEALKAGEKVDLKIVDGKTTAVGGKVTYKLRTLARDIEVTKVDRPKNPADPELPVTVEFNVTKDQSDLIEKSKEKTVVGKGLGKAAGPRKVPVPLRVEPVETEKKKK